MLWTNFGIWSMHLGCTFKKGPLIEIEYIMKWIVTWFECLEMDALKGGRFKVLEGWKGTFQWVKAWYNMPLFTLCCDRLEVVQWIHTAKKENPSCTPTYVILGNLILVYNISFFYVITISNFKNTAHTDRHSHLKCQNKRKSPSVNEIPCCR